MECTVIGREVNRGFRCQMLAGQGVPVEALGPTMLRGLRELVQLFRGATRAHRAA